MHSSYKKQLQQLCTLFALCMCVLFFFNTQKEEPPVSLPKKAEAIYQFFPTGGAIVTGSNPAILGATLAAAEGVNVGDFRGALADDNTHFGITSTDPGGYNAYLDIGNVHLQGANKLLIQTEFDLDATAPDTLVQICDWVSSTGVHNTADAQCSGGGWRNLNLNDTVINTATANAYDWQIYDGYWNTGATTTLSTPLSNFTGSSSTVRIRYYSTTNTTSLVHIDYLRVFAVINPVYSASSAQRISGGTVTGDYSLATIGGDGQTGIDNARFRVAGTAGSIADFYMSYTNVRTYPGANTILMRTEYSCSTATGNITPKIYNFTTSLWEDLSSAGIACNATDATNGWAKNNVTISDYVFNGEVRVGWYTSVVGTHEIRIDRQHIMIGTTNSDGASEISFGTNSSGDVTDTQDLDMTGTTNTWSILSEDESDTQAFAFYGLDGDNDGTAEEVSSANMDFDLSPPLNTAVTGIFFASRHMSGAGGTVQVAVRDYGGLAGVTGGWSLLGATGATSLTYSDNITVGTTVATGGVGGLQNNPEDYIDYANNKMNLKLRSTGPGATTNNSVAQWDFAMVSLQWVEDENHSSTRYQFTPTGGAIVTGSNPPILGITAAGTDGVNTGDYRGALANDNTHFGITSTNPGGYNAYLDVGGVQLNGANKIFIQTEFDLDATIPTTLVQICDWVSSTGVHNAADAQCTGGGWRNLNLNDTVINTATASTYDWEIYDGYWNTGATTTLSTPLSNFTGSSSTIRIRYYSTTNTTSLVNIDYLFIYAVINPVYSASSAQKISGGTVAGDYTLATIGGIGQTGSDNAYFRVPGTAGSISDFYFSFTNVATYEGANTIVVRAEYSCSVNGVLSHRPKIYNFNTTSWEDLTTGSILCAADATNSWAKNNITISDYVENGEVRVGWYGLANSTTEIRIDRLHMMIGTTNTDGVSELTYGTNSSGDVTDTQDMDTTGTTNTWSILSADESNTQSFASNGLDSDNDAALEEASSANMDFNLTLASNTLPTGIFFASRHMSGAGGTVQLGVKDYSGLSGTLGGWVALGGTGATTQSYTDNITTASVAATGGVAGMQNNPEDYIDTINNVMNLRLRSPAPGASTTNSTAQWDFAMVSLQWVEVPFVDSLTFSLSDTSVSFGSLSQSSTRYASGTGQGQSTPVTAHTFSASTNADGGYAISVSGNTLTCSTCGDTTISPIGSTATTSTAGSEQFGLNIEVYSGTGSTSQPYDDTALWAFATSSFPDLVATGLGDDIETVYKLQYIGNVDSLSEVGSYNTSLTYLVTGMF